MIFFDYDGVIADSLWLWEISCQMAARQMDFQGEFPLKPYARLNPLAHRFIGEQLGLDPARFEELADEHFLQYIHLVKMFSGTKELVADLSQNYRLSIMSASCQEIVENSLRNFGILEYFTQLYCGSKVSKGEKLKTYKESASIMIGDGISDMQAARYAGVYGIGVLWGWQEMQMLEDSHITVENHSQLKKAIKDFYENNSSY